MGIILAGATLLSAIWLWWWFTSVAENALLGAVAILWALAVILAAFQVAREESD